MSDKETGGQAFPLTTWQSPDGMIGLMNNPGMTLRDWFAGQAVAGLFNHSGWVATHDGDGEEVAKRAYAVADAMLAART